jgi:hypothetical protein
MAKNKTEILFDFYKLQVFVQLVAASKRSDGTYNHCREALEKKAKKLLKELDEKTVDNLGKGDGAKKP